MAETTTQTLPVLPLSQGVVLPQMVVTIALETDEARAVAAAVGTGGRLLLVPRLDGRYAQVGTVAGVEDRGPLPNGTPALVIRAERRARVGAGVVGEGDALWVQAELVEDSAPTERTHELAREYRAAAGLLLERLGGRRMSAMLRDVEEPGALADTAGWWPDLSIERKVELLEATDVDRRLEMVTAWVKEALADGELADRIRSDVSEGMEKTQREFLLRQQLAAIRRELGEEGDDEDGIEAYRARLADRDIPAEVGAAIERELGRLERTSPQAAESGWIRTWLDTVVELPWGVRSTDHLDLGDARAVLDADHSGLDEVKDRIVEELAVRKLRLARAGEPESPTGRDRPSILVLVGPPGVGKTSLGESVARALGRSFVRVALGGVRDEAEIRGHRRTYVGAQPGRIVRAMVEAGTMNPVFLLDEIDKVGSDWRGDPSSALLEVLDPAQNHSFRDHYLEVDLDLSGVLFIATANVLDTVPAPLLDRMEVITLDGYTDEEKLVIARDHLLGRQLERNGLRSDEVTVTDDALATLVADYTREAGVRSLERQLGKVLRKTATKVAARADTEGGQCHRHRGVHGRRARGPPGAGPGPGHPRRGQPHAGHRRGERPGRHRRRGRRAGGGGHGHGRRAGPHPHRPARRRDDRIGPDRAVVHPGQPPGAGHRPGGTGTSHPRALPGGSRAQGRALGRGHHDHGAGQPPERSAGEAVGGHDRRGHPARQGASHRRRQAEAAGRPPGRHHRRRHSRPQRTRPGRPARHHP